MKPRINPPIPPKHTAEVTFDGDAAARRRLMDSEFCDACGKLRLRTKADAHSYIGLLLSKRWRESRANDHTFAPYRCPIKGWHVGRNPKTAQLLETRHG